MFVLEIFLNCLVVFATLVAYYWGLERYGVWKALGLAVLAFIVMLFIAVAIELTVTVVVLAPMILML